jgi:hypothetical protein
MEVIVTYIATLVTGSDGWIIIFIPMIIGNEVNASISKVPGIVIGSGGRKKNITGLVIDPMSR